MKSTLSLPECSDLRQHVRATLCQQDRLDPAQVLVGESLVTRDGRACGLFFQLRGPRRLATYALWAAEESRILFYDSTGRRFAETTLTESPELGQWMPARAA
jgi:hypothetical protein